MFEDGRFHEYALLKHPNVQATFARNMDVLSTCLLQLKIIHEISSDISFSPDGSIYWIHRQLWAKIFSSLQDRLNLNRVPPRPYRFNPSTHSAHDTHQAAECLTLIEQVQKSHSKNKEMFDNFFITVLRIHAGQYSPQPPVISIPSPPRSESPVVPREKSSPTTDSSSMDWYARPMSPQPVAVEGPSPYPQWLRTSLHGEDPPNPVQQPSRNDQEHAVYTRQCQVQ